MEEPMSPENQGSVEEAFRALETQLAALRGAAKSLRDDRPSWADNVFHPGRRARQEADFSTALVSALKDFTNAIAHQNSKVAHLERQLSELRTERFASLEKEVREHHERVAREQAEATEAATTRATELREQIGKIQDELASRQNELAASQKDLGNEFRERIQHLLDEQRVAIRQLALKASEEAVLSDRARRAMELKLEELAKRLPPA
jgi:chromosome segregation ATPase